MHKNTTTIRTFIFTAITTLNCACYNKFDAPKEYDTEDVVTNITPKELSLLLSADEYLDVDKDLRIRGYVTAHDESGNFYKTFVIESGGYGVEILEGLNDSYIRHDIGYEMVVSLNGLRLSRSRGVVQVGIATEYGSYYDIDFLGHEYLINQHITNTGNRQIVQPRELTLSHLKDNPELATALYGSLVRIVNLRYYPYNDSEERLWGGTKRFIDANDPLVNGEPNCAIWCYVSSYAKFSELEIPSNPGAITAIMQGADVEGGMGWEMMLKPRSTDDLEF